MHLKLKITPLLLRFQQYNIRALLEKLTLRNRGVGQINISGSLITVSQKSTEHLSSLLFSFIFLLYIINVKGYRKIDGNLTGISKNIALLLEVGGCGCGGCKKERPG